jgi:predicted ATPase
LVFTGTKSRQVVLFGCSSGGKSTLWVELARRGFSTVREPSRRIVEEEMCVGRGALLWVNLAAFAKRAVEVARDDLENADCAARWVSSIEVLSMRLLRFNIY